MDSSSLTFFNKMYFQLRRFANYAATEWDMQWTLTAVALIAIILFLLREKPLTNMVIWLKNKLVAFFKWLWKQLKRLFSKIKFKPLSPKLNQFAKQIDGLDASQFGRYNRPHYIALSWDADVQQVMNGAHDHDPEGLILEDYQLNEDSGKNWFIFNKGCVFDFPDPIAVSKELQQIRPERPLDGIILCISAKTLLESDSRKINQQAEHYYKQLWKLQKQFQFVLPVYLIITDCENIAGFDAYWRINELNRHHQDMLGWSNPNEKFHQFEAQWITDAIGSITSHLRNLQLKLMGSAKPSLDLLLFPSRLARLRKPITNICEVLFSQSSFHDSFMFRGFYFSGKLNANENNAETEGELLFVRDLFHRRIFAEANLAFAPKQKVFSSDRKLRVFQYLTATVMIALTAWLTFDAIELDHQASNLYRTISSLPAQPEQSEVEETNLYVSRVLDHVAHMDASNLQYTSIPLSWTGGFDHKLTQYFAHDIFGNIVFPSLECKANDSIAMHLNAYPEDDNFEGWLAELAEEYEVREKLHQLMLTNNLTEGEVESRFDYLVNHLFEKKLPESFYNRSTTYFDAIRNVSYKPLVPVDEDTYNQPLKPGELCRIRAIDTEHVWERVQQMAVRHGDIVAQKVAAPVEFFDKVTELESLPLDTDWYRLDGSFADELQHYLEWSAELKQSWLVDHVDQNSCSTTYRSLAKLSTYINGGKVPFLDNFFNHCMQEVSYQFHQDRALMQPLLYLIEGNNLKLSDEAENLLASMQDLSSLTFINSEKPKPFNKNDHDFFWSVEHLNRALRMFDEYKNFATVHYDGMSLPRLNSESSRNYVAQAVALKQLQLAMVTAISDARIKESEQRFPDRFRPVNQQEAKLTSYMSNFVEARDALLRINQIFNELNFAESERWLTNLANNQAYNLLQKVDSLYRNSRLYEPMPEPLWGAHKYTHAMYGITSEGQLQDYLVAQSERIELIGFNYVEPILVFLRATNARSTNYQLFSRWENTLIELNKKQQHKDASNSQKALEDFFNNQLLLTDQSNCFKQGKEFIEPQQNDMFAITQREIVDQARSLCQSYTADQILKEYSELFSLFTNRLANKYPFTRSSAARSVSPRELKDFLERYSGSNTGLAKRMSILQWAKRDSADKGIYESATQFVEQLDLALAFFSSVISASETNKDLGLELVFEFDVLQEQAEQIGHISEWQLQIGKQRLSYPSADEQEQTTLAWRPNQDVNMKLQWAENSPYSARAINGKSKGRELRYPADGTWSLLKFIDLYQSSLIDNEALSDSSILLNFKASLSTSESGQDDNYASALARITLYGPDMQTKELKAITLPKQFPDHAPDIYAQSKGAQP